VTRSQAPPDCRRPVGQRWLCAALVAAAASSFVAYAWLVAQRMTYPFELNYIESAVADQVGRVATGRALYVSPSPEFVPLIYTPLYFWVAGRATMVVGDPLVAARAVSVTASIASMAIIALFVRRRTRGWSAPLVAAGLFAASFAACGGWFDVARVDSLFVMLLLGALLVSDAQGAGSRGAAGCLGACAVATKQSALLPALGVIAADLWFRGGRGNAAVGAFASTLAVGGVVLHWSSGGWSTYYVARMAAGQAQNWSMLWRFWVQDVGRLLAPGALAGALLWVTWGRRAEDRGERGYLFAIAACLLLTAWQGRLTAGGFPNVLMPVCAAVAVLGGLAVHEAMWERPQPPWVATAMLAACAAQFVAFTYNPLRHLPSESDRHATEALVRMLRESGGPVLIPSHTCLARAAGLAGSAHRAAISDVLQGDPATANRAILQPLRTAIASGQFALVVLDRPEWFADVLPGAYVGPSPAFERAGDGWPVVGWATRPDSVYRRVTPPGGVGK
jgi:hypothetical protein